MQFALEKGTEYNTHFAYLLRAPTLILWWGLPVILANILVCLYPWVVDSGNATKALSAFFILGLLYFAFLYFDRNKYLRRTVYSLSFNGEKVHLKTLARDCELSLPVNLKEVGLNVLKRHMSTYGSGEALYEIVTIDGPIYLSSRAGNFESIRAVIVGESSIG